MEGGQGFLGNLVSKLVRTPAHPPLHTPLLPTRTGNGLSQILIVSSWRSGSTFLGDLLNSFPGTFYYFEPLHYFFTAKDELIREEKEQLELLGNLYNCSFPNSSKPFLRHLSKFPFLMKKHNWRLWRNCTGLLLKEPGWPGGSIVSTISR